MSTSPKNRILGALWGALVGDALGVPVEFRNRRELEENPVINMREYGTHGQPRGTWSDDGALTLCTIESLLHRKFDIEDMGHRFLAWYHEGLWAAHGRIFDIGIATGRALSRIAEGVRAESAGGTSESSNGNGSLMRILPVALRFAQEDAGALADRVSRASSITHGHPRSHLACALFSLVVRELLQGHSPSEAVQAGRKNFLHLYAGHRETPHFWEALDESLPTWSSGRIDSSGYVIATLTASLWCLLTTNNFPDCVLKAVNLGDDSDTTGCVAGGLAGLAYGMDQVPDSWRATLPRQHEIRELFDRFTNLITEA